MREALEAVKRELGPNAVILGTRMLPAAGIGVLAGREMAEISAAPADASVQGPRISPRQKRSESRPKSGDNGKSRSVSTETPQKMQEVPQHLYPHYVRLVESEVTEEIASSLVREAALRVPVNGDESALRTVMQEYIAGMLPSAGGIELPEGASRRVAFVGPSGAGKTTTLAKLAAHFKLRMGKRVGLLTLDTQRIGANDQLQRYADLLEVPFRVAQTITEAKAALKGLEGLDVVLIDTMGVGLREQGRFARLASLLRAVRVDETHLVLPASLAPDVQARVAKSFAPLETTRVVLTRLDDAIGLGIVLNVVQRLNIRVSYLSTGQNIPDDIEEACGKRFASLLLANG